jgi:hypothetical protein
MVGPRRSWLLPKDGSPAVLFLDGIWDTVVRDKAVPRTQKGWTFRKRHQSKLETSMEKGTKA